MFLSENIQTQSLVQNCEITSRAGMITAMCNFPFQMTVQINDIDEVNVLHINTTMDTQTPVTVEVRRNSEYRITVFPLQAGLGILSGMAFSQIIINETQGI